MRQVREIEVKYRVHDPAAVEEALKVHGVSLSDPVHQDDQAYAPQGWHYGMSKLGVAFAQLRTQDGRHLFTLKRPTDNKLACLEYEIEVADREQMHQAIQQMGFYPTVRIMKTRRTGRSGDLSLCLDDVVNAGVFLEIEKVVESGAGEFNRSSIPVTAKCFGKRGKRARQSGPSSGATPAGRDGVAPL